MRALSVLSLFLLLLLSQPSWAADMGRVSKDTSRQITEDMGRVSHAEKPAKQNIE